MFIGLKVVLSVSGDMLFENEQCVRQQKVEEVAKGKLKKLLKGMRRGRSGMERQRWKLRGRLARRAAPIRSIDGFRVVEKAERGSNKMMKGCDIGYALAANSCEGVNRVDACTVTAFDVIAAFATSGPNLPLAKPVGFFGSERPANYFALAITQPTSDRQRFIETNPFDRRRKPDIGYAPAASSCERVDHVDACTVSACYVTIAFAISGPSLLLAEPAGFFGSERPLNCFIVRITQPTSDQLLFISTALSTVDAGDPKSEQLIVNTQHLCKRTNIWRGSAFDENRMNCGFGNLHQGCFPDIHSAFHKKRCSTGRTLPIRRQQNHLLTANSACLIVCLRDSFARRFKQAYRVSRNNRGKSTAGSRMSGLIAYVDGGSHGSPGPSGIGVVIETPDGEQIRIAKWIGHQDNNVAEYAALLEALQRAVEMKATALHVFTDSQLVVKQMTGEYACNSPRLYSLNWTCRKLARSLNFAIAHIPRHRNQEANRLANDAARASRS